MALTNPNQPAWTPIDTGGQLAVADIDAVVDNVFVFDSITSPTTKVRRVVDGTYRASWAGVFAGGVAATNASRLNTILANSSVKEVVFDNPEGGDIPLSGTITASNKVFTFSGDFAFTGTYTINNIAIDASYNQVIFKGTPTIVAPQSVSGKFSAKWWGVLADGNDISAKLAIANTSINTSFQKEIVFTGASAHYSLSSTVTISNGVGLSFERGAVINASAALNGGVILAPMDQYVFTPGSLINPFNSENYWISAAWFGANSSAADNQPAIQTAISVLNRNKTRFTLVALPQGDLAIQNPVACAEFNSGLNRYEQVRITLKGVGEGYSTAFPSAGTTLVPTFKDRPAVWFQICKSGGLESVGIRGQFTPPTMTDAEFFNSSVGDFIDPTCRSDRYSPYCGVCVDPVSYTGAPTGGGYPGLSGLGGNFIYTAPGNNATSGSSGLTFRDINISNFTVCSIHSPNGVTRNAEMIEYDNIRVANFQIGFASCQDQEKQNIYRRITAWNEGHTLISNRTYGQQGSGSIYVYNVNFSARNNRMFDWSCGGFFPSYCKDVYAENLGRFGSVATSGLSFVVTDSNFNFTLPAAMGNYSPDWHIDAANGVFFKGCSIRIYGTSNPIIIRYNGTSSGNAIFEDCYFNSVPTFWNESDRGGPSFENCYLTQLKFGATSNYNAALSAVRNWSVLGNYVASNYIPYRQPSTARSEWNINGRTLYEMILVTGSKAVTVDGNREYTINVGASVSSFSANINIWLNTGATFIYGGMVKSIDVGAQTITVQNVPIGVANSTYGIYGLAYIGLYSFMGDTTSGSNVITNVRTDNEIGVFAGAVLQNPIFSNRGIVTAVTSTTVTVSLNATQDAVGVYFTPTNVQKVVVNNFPQLDGTAIPAATILQQGSRIISAKRKYKQELLITKTGFFNAAAASPVDTRQAEWCAINLPTVIDSFYPGDVGKPSNGSTTYTNEMLFDLQVKDFIVNIAGVDLPYNSAIQLSYTYNPLTATITITNGTFDSTQYVFIKGR